MAAFFFFVFCFYRVVLVAVPRALLLFPIVEVGGLRLIDPIPLRPMFS